MISQKSKDYLFQLNYFLKKILEFRLDLSLRGNVGCQSVNNCDKRFYKRIRKNEKKMNVEC